MRIAFIAATIAVLAWVFQAGTRPGAYAGIRSGKIPINGLAIGEVNSIGVRARVNIDFDNFIPSTNPPAPIVTLVGYRGRQGFGWAESGRHSGSAYGYGLRISPRQLPVYGRSVQKTPRGFSPVSFGF